MLFPRLLKTAFVCAFCACSFFIAAAGNLKPAALFSDHMVLQRDSKLVFWGTDTPGSTVTVNLNGQTANAVADANGKWTANLQAMPAGGPHELKITSAAGDKVIIKDVLIGEVWICSGQSNMAMSVMEILNPGKELDRAANNLIRHFKVTLNPSLTPEADVSGSWVAATPDTVGYWSAAGYFFARRIQAKLNVPVGLIHTSYGGASVEAWTSREVLENCHMDDALKQIEKIRKDMTPERIAALDKNHSERNALIAGLHAKSLDQAYLNTYSAPVFDDTQWKSLESGECWEKKALPRFDGEVWLRKTIVIPPAWAGRPLVLSLGPVDECDQTFFNGKLVGGRGSFFPVVNPYWNVGRVYNVPAELVKAGSAVIAVRVIDLQGGGGLVGKNTEMFLTPQNARPDDGIVPLSGSWRYLAMDSVPMNLRSPVGPTCPAALFNGMLSGLIPYAVRGVIWYQGESNEHNAYQYRERFPAMVRDWQTRWGAPLPFLYVQLAAFKKPPVQPEDSKWAVVRESQKLSENNLIHGIVAIDIGDAGNIHPKNKMEIGRRLALLAQAHIYTAESGNVIASGPVFRSMKIEGSAIRLTFDTFGKGLISKDNQPLKQFAIAGADGKFVWADARIDGDTVVVSAPSVSAPAAVRYAWATNPAGANLCNSEGLPAGPFRTDSFRVVTQPECAK